MLKKSITVGGHFLPVLAGAFVALPLAASGSSSQVLEEVLVTAQKREQALSDLPVSVSVVDADMLSVRQSNTLADLARHVPGLQIASPNGSILPIIAIRGVSMSDYNVNQASPVGVYLDEIYLSSNYTHGLALFDLERVEVLRGPQGTLYGKNTTGGAINLISREPDLEADGYIDLGIGSYGRQFVKSAYESPLSESLAVRVAVQAEQADGFSKNHFPGGADLSSANRYAGRVTIKWQPDDSFTAVLRLNGGYSNPETRAVVSTGTDPGGLDRLNSTFALFDLPYYQRPESYGYHDTNSNKVDHTRAVTEGAILSLSKEFEAFTLSSVSGYYRGDYDHMADSDGTPSKLLETDWRGDIQQWSQDLRLSSYRAENLGWTVGIYAAGEKHQVHNNFQMFHGLELIAPEFGPNSGFTLDQQYEQSRDSLAAYGQLEYAIGKAQRLTMGLRYSVDENRQFNVHSWQGDYAGQAIVGLIPFSLPYDPEAVYPSEDFTDREWTGTLKWDYRLSDEALLYASYSHGYRSGAFNGAAILMPSELAPVGPEFIDALEVGVHARWLDSNLSLNAAAFHYDYDHQQFLNVVGIQQLLDSADAARSRGIELELVWQAFTRLSAQLGLSLLETEYTDGPVLNVLNVPKDLSGNKLMNAPELTLDFALDYEQPLRSGNFRAHIDAAYTGEQWYTPFNGDYGYENIGQPGHTLANARLEYSWEGQRYQVSLWGSNLTDKEYQVYAINLSETFGYHYSIKGEPRTYGLGFRMNF